MRGRAGELATAGPIASLSIGEHGLPVSGLPPGATQPPPWPSARSGGGIEARGPDGGPAEEVYFLGIIDILQQYDLRKMGETVLKSLVHPVAGISAVGPRFYAERFVEFLTEHTE